MRSATRRSGLSPFSPSSVKLGVRRRVHLDGAAPAALAPAAPSRASTSRRQTHGERDERAQSIA